jgi:hypothetical protein
VLDAVGVVVEGVGVASPDEVGVGDPIGSVKADDGGSVVPAIRAATTGSNLSPDREMLKKAQAGTLVPSGTVFGNIERETDGQLILQADQFPKLRP